MRAQLGRSLDERASAGDDAARQGDTDIAVGVAADGAAASGKEKLVGRGFGDRRADYGTYLQAAGAPVVFTRNRLEIATLPGNPEKIASLKDLSRSGLKVVLCDKTVPCGAAARKALDAGGVKLTPVSYEEDVKGALNKVVLKEADAAVVYRTDVRAAGDKVEGVDFPEAAKAVNDYPIALLKNARNITAAQAFIDLVRSAEGRKVLTEAGFLTP
jgi:molybdate transport system substrate-binding protein